MSATRQCPFTGCPEKIAPSLFACRRHWYALSKPDRDEIWAAYRLYLGGGISAEHLRRVQQEVLRERPEAP